MLVRKLLIIPALLALGVTVSAGAAQATARPAAPATAPVVLTEDEAIDEPGNGVAVCNGGVQESALVRTNDLPTNLVENGAFAPLPGAAIAFSTPANDSDQIIVTFAAEARLTGQPVTFTPPVDFVQIQVLLDGVPMLPLNDLTFTTVAGEANATETCRRLPANAMAVGHVVSVQWMLVDQPMNQNLTGVIDDWTLHVEINN